MKKTIIALAVLGATAGIAHAQSNVTIYGVVDTGISKESGSSTAMTSNETSRIGFRGQEDLGNGLKATFQLEQRLNLNDGTASNSDGLADRIQDQNRNALDLANGRTSVQFKGAANIGLAGSFGAVRFGRVNDISTETYRTLDPFNQNGIGASLYNPLRSEQLANTVRYDSPNVSGFSGALSYTLKAQESTTPNNADTRKAGYNVGLKYDNGPVNLLANYGRLADTDSSSVWNVGGAYSFGPAKVSLAYQRTKVKENALDLFQNAPATTGNDLKQTDWLVGLSWKLGPGTLMASYNRAKIDDVIDGNDKVQKYGIGYTYDLSKRTSVYGVIAHTKSDSEALARAYTNNGGTDDSATSYGIGLNHKF